MDEMQATGLEIREREYGFDIVAENGYASFFRNDNAQALSFNHLVVEPGKPGIEAAKQILSRSIEEAKRVGATSIRGAILPSEDVCAFFLVYGSDAITYQYFSANGEPLDSPREGDKSLAPAILDYKVS